AGDHRGRAAVRIAAVRGDHHRERVLAAGAGLDADRRDPRAQLPGGAGRGAGRRGDLRGRQHRGRPVVRARRPEDPAGMTATPTRGSVGAALSAGAWLGLAMLAVFVAAGVLGPVIAPYDLGVLRVELTHQFAPPSAAHWLGSDASGRDTLSQVL